MEEKVLIRRWNAAFAAAGAVVAAVAALLLVIIGVANRIAGNARRTLGAAQQVYDNTCAVWSLDDTNAAAVQLLNETRGIEQNALRIADALERPR